MDPGPTLRESSAGGSNAPGVFPKTRWSVVLDAQDADPAALATFCRSYWAPLYSFARRKGMSVEDAEDLTQAFFEHLLSRDFLTSARRERGRLRNFLLGAFNNFATDEWRRAGARKRGGSDRVVPMDFLLAEEQLAREFRDGTNPELEYERAWARALLRRAVDELGATYARMGKQAVFQALEDQLVDGNASAPYREIGATLGVSEAAARYSAFVLRQQFRETLHRIVADTVGDPGDVETELAHLRTVFRN